MVLHMKVGSPRGEVRAAESKELDIVGVFRISIVETDHLLAVQPVLNDRPFAYDPPCVPLPNGLGGVFGGRHTEVQRGRTAARVLAVCMNLVVQDLILVLAGPVVYFLPIRET